MKEKQQLSVILPLDLTEVFQEEVKKRTDQTNHGRGHQADIIKEALYKYFNMEEPKKLNSSKSMVPLETYKKVGIEDVVNVLEKGELYDFSILKQITGLSRTTLRRIVIDNPDWFEKQEDRGSNGKDHFLLIKGVTRPASAATTKRKRTRKKAKEFKNTDKETINNVDKGNRKAVFNEEELTRQALEAIVTYQIEKEGDELNEPHTITHVDQGKGEDDRVIGLLDHKKLNLYRGLADQGKITPVEFGTLRMQNYFENPTYWKEIYNGNIDKIELRLSQIKDLKKKVRKILKS